MEDRGKNLLPRRAERENGDAYMTPGAQLATKDGRHIGNAFVEIVYVDPYMGAIARIVTDRGNTRTMTESELRRSFHPPQVFHGFSSCNANRTA